jgi:predicted dehydrogenase
MSTPFTFGVVGAGWRAEFFVRLARLLSDQLTLVGASVRRSEVAEQLTRRWGVPAFLSPTELVHSRRPDFVISCVPSSANPEVGVMWQRKFSGVRRATPSISGFILRYN